MARLYEQHRGSSSSRGYDRRWEKARDAHLRGSPLCRYCQLEGRVTAADLVDHLYPHNGDQTVFWMQNLWVSSCTPCHSRYKQKIEARGLDAIDALAARLGIPSLSRTPVPSSSPNYTLA